MIKILKQQEEQVTNDNETVKENKEQVLEEPRNQKSELIPDLSQSDLASSDVIVVSTELTPEAHEIEKRESRAIKVLSSMLCVVVLALGIGFCRFYPLATKVSGSWSYHENSLNYQLVNEGKESRFTILNLQDQKDVNLVFISQLKPAAANRYKAEETKVQLEIKKSDATKAGINALRKDQINYRLVSETPQKICFSYTKTGVITNFGDTDINRLFDYQITDFKFGLFPVGLSIENKTFAYGGLKLVKK